MGEAARRAFLRGTTPTERFDAGLQLWARRVQSIIEAVEIPADATPEQRAKLQFDALRRSDR